MNTPFRWHERHPAVWCAPASGIPVAAPWFQRTADQVVGWWHVWHAVPRRVRYGSSWRRIQWQSAQAVGVPFI